MSYEWLTTGFIVRVLSTLTVPLSGSKASLPWVFNENDRKFVTLRTRQITPSDCEHLPNKLGIEEADELSAVNEWKTSYVPTSTLLLGELQKWVTNHFNSANATLLSYLLSGRQPNLYTLLLTLRNLYFGASGEHLSVFCKQLSRLVSCHFRSLIYASCRLQSM